MVAKAKSNTRAKLSKLQSWRWLALLAVLVGAIILAAVTSKISAASATLSFSPSSGSYTVGSTFTVAVQENSGSDSVSSVQADFTYNQSDLQFVSIDGNSSGFSVAAPSTGGSGSVSISRGAVPAVSGNQLVANVSFKVLAAGNAALTFDPVCQGNSSSNCIAVVMVTNSVGTNIATASSGASYTLQSAPSGSSSSGSSSSSSSSGSGSSSSSSSGSSSGGSSSGGSSSGGTTVKKTTTPSTTNKTTSTSVTPTNSVNSATVPDDGAAQVTEPVNIQPATIQVEGVKDVQYYLNGKLAYTSTNPPYTYHINTKNMLNGTYNMVVKTVYDNGKVSTSTTKLIVSNPFSLEQLWLYVRKYLLAPILIILAGVIALIAFFRLRRLGWFGGDSSGQGGGLGTDYSSQSQPPVVTPTSMYSQAETVPVTEEAGDQGGQIPVS